MSKSRSVYGDSAGRSGRAGDKSCACPRGYPGVDRRGTYQLEEFVSRRLACVWLGSGSGGSHRLGMTRTKDAQFYGIRLAVSVVESSG